VQWRPVSSSHDKDYVQIDTEGLTPKKRAARRNSQLLELFAFDDFSLRFREGWILKEKLCI
jgi:hypothetical protein